MQTIDTAHVRAKARTDWERALAVRNRPHFLDLVQKSVPYWLVIVAGTMFALSAPHTAATFNKITPGFGWTAPLGVEFGLLYAAFMRRMNRRSDRSTSLLEVLLVFTAIIVNGAGAFTSVVSSANLQNLPLDKLLAGFAGLPASDQVTLVLVVIAAFIIPTGTVVGGHGLAEFIAARTATGREAEQAQKEEQWSAAQPQVLYQAYFDALTSAGYTPGRAAKLAATYVRADIANVVENVDNADERGQTSDREQLGKGEAVSRLERLRESDPQFVHYSPEKQMELSGVGRSAVYKWRKPYQNGHSQETWQ